MKTTLNREQVANKVESYLFDVLREQKSASKQIDSAYTLLWENTQKLIFAGGKRLRPYLVYLGYSLDSGNDEILPVAAAQELLHSALLIHDDIIDRDTIRHGTANLNGIYEELYAPYLEKNDSSHYAYGAALLAGDLLISLSFKLLYGSEFSHEIKQKLTEQHYRSIYEVAGGELLDVEASFRREAAFDPILISRYKTASYSFEGPLLCGAICAGASSEDKQALQEYGQSMGVAYQLQDDLIGVFGDMQITGKSTISDLKEGKATLLINEFKARAGKENLRLHERIFGNPEATQEEFEVLKMSIQNSGAKQAVENAVQEYSHKAARALDDFSHSPQKEQLLVLANKLMERST